MRQHTLHHYCHLLFCLLVNSARLAFVQADGNVFLRGVSTAQAQTVLQKEANNCPGVRSLMGDFPVITGATTSISTQQSQQQTSGEFNDGSFSFSQQVLYKCSEDPQVLETPGVWYSLSGRDAFVHAALLFESVTNQKMAIFEASDCQPSQCLMVSNSFSKQLDWFAKSDKTYFIKVFATTPALSGTFILQLEVCMSGFCMYLIVSICAGHTLSLTYFSLPSTHCSRNSLLPAPATTCAKLHSY